MGYYPQVERLGTGMKFKPGDIVRRTRKLSHHVESYTVKCVDGCRVYVEPSPPAANVDAGIHDTFMEFEPGTFTQKGEPYFMDLQLVESTLKVVEGYEKAMD